MDGFQTKIKTELPIKWKSKDFVRVFKGFESNMLPQFWSKQLINCNRRYPLKKSDTVF